MLYENDQIIFDETITHTTNSSFLNTTKVLKVRDHSILTSTNREGGVLEILGKFSDGY